MRILAILIAALAIQSCGNGIQTDPSVILPVLKEAQRCCDGRCDGMYSAIPEEVACADARQLEDCLSGDDNECPVKGQGAF